MNSVVTSRKSTILAAALASLTAGAFFFAADSADAAPHAPVGDVAQLSTRTAGGPIKVGGVCWTETDRSRGFGYYDLCDSYSAHVRSRSQFYDEHANGGDGGSGDGGSGGDGGGEK